MPRHAERRARHAFRQSPGRHAARPVEMTTRTGLPCSSYKACPAACLEKTPAHAPLVIIVRSQVRQTIAVLPAMPSMPTSAQSRPPLILNVEARDGPRYAKSRILHRAGFSVIEAATGQAALSLTRQHGPDLVLLSVTLPDIGGEEVCGMLKADPQTARCLVLYTAARTPDPRGHAHARDGGADGIVMEPVEPEELISGIEALLRMRGAEDACRRTSQALHEHEDLFRQLAESLADVVWILDPDKQRFLFMSPSFGALWGRPASTVMAAPRDEHRLAAAPEHPESARRWLDWLPDAERARIEPMWDTMLGDCKLDTEFLLQRPDGEMREVRMRAFPVHGGESTRRRVAGIWQDVTHAKRGERLLRDEEQRKDEFLAMLAHELRNPLAPMRSAVDLLRQARPSREDTFRARDILDRQLHHLTRLVDELLDISRFNQGRIALRRTLVELRAALNTAVETVRPLLDERGHTLRLSLPEAPLPVHGDLVRLTQIFANLLHNAARYTPPGGTIAVRAHVAGDKVTVQVTDNGAGLSPALQRQLFDPLAPLPPAGDRPRAQSGNTKGDTKHVRTGPGVGLTLTRKLVTLHDGRITAHSAGPGQGSTFTVTLPVEPWQDWHPAQHQAPAGAGTPHKILLVDDNTDALEAMTMTLQALGHTVTTASDGEGAVARAASVHPDVVLLDLGMPAMDGFETARRLRALPQLRRARLVALTGFGQPEDRRRTREAGFDLHVVKPADLEALSRMFDELDRLPVRDDAPAS